MLGPAAPPEASPPRGPLHCAQVSRKSHAYLQPVFWNLTSANFSGNVSAAYEQPARRLAEQVSSGSVYGSLAFALPG